MNRLEIARQQIDFAHRYTQSLLETLNDEEWLWRPPGDLSHIAWQVGHIAMAQYGLTMIRIRGKEPEDESFMPAAFFKTFKKGSQPSQGTGGYTPAQIREVYEAVHRQTRAELSRYSDSDLDVKLPEPHAVFDTKLGSLFFCSAHEMLHAGQIGLLRRLMGKPPIR
jgi:DinB superfamily